tara:strand:- start:172 stop:948 length:777 start_codon:yes stop_codon:yes gene_type:complete
MKEIKTFEDKTIIIVGSTGLLGKSLVEHFLKLEANVVGVDFKKGPLKKQEKKYLGNSFSAIYGDITDLRSIKTIINKTAKKFNGIDAAVNVAYPKNKAYGTKLWDVSLNNFSDNLKLHLGGYFLFMRECAKYSIKEDKKFSLVNFSSIYGLIQPNFDLYKETSMTLPVEYVAIKSGIQSLSKYFSSYTKGSRFRVNCVCPGGILDGQDEVFLKKYNSYARTKGMLDSKDINGVTAFLCSDESEFICGQDIVVDDGFSF